MNWYSMKKFANALLGNNLGKWLVLESRGQRNEAGVQNDIKTFVMQNPTGIDPSAARGAAISYYVSQTKQQPDQNLTGLLDQWLSMVEGNSVSPEQNSPMQTPVPNEVGVVNENITI